jgi:hypothetical protein
VDGTGISGELIIDQGGDVAFPRSVFADRAYPKFYLGMMCF